MAHLCRFPLTVGTTVLLSSKSSWGGAVATRPVCPECLDASSGCVSKSPHDSVSGWGRHEHWREGCVRPSIRAGQGAGATQAERAASTSRSDGCGSPPRTSGGRSSPTTLRPQPRLRRPPAWSSWRLWLSRSGRRPAGGWSTTGAPDWATRPGVRSGCRRRTSSA